MSKTNSLLGTPVNKRDREASSLFGPELGAARLKVLARETARVEARRKARKEAAAKERKRERDRAYRASKRAAAVAA